MNQAKKYTSDVHWFPMKQVLPRGANKLLTPSEANCWYDA